MYDNPFVLKPEEYKRSIVIMDDYVEDAALYLAKMKNTTIEKARAFVTKVIAKGGRFEFKDPECFYLERNEVGDREKKYGTVLQYINDAIRRRDLIAPTLTTYLHPKRKQSMLVEFIDNNVKARGVAKKEKFAAKQDGNKVLEDIKEIDQTGRKLSNNSISGAHVSASTPLYNKTAHSTLTSLCRSTSGYGNANNEKMLAGNRHYWSEDIIRNNIISIVRNTNYADLLSTMEKYSMAYPTIEDVKECIHWSAKLYRISLVSLRRIDLLIEKLNPLERAAFVYVGDLYHIAKHNDALVRTFIKELSARVEADCPNAEDIMKNAMEDHVHLAATLCPQETKGQKIDKLKGTKAYETLAATTKHIGDTITEYAPFIKTFFVTPNVPASVAHLPDSIRRVALTSDTDSTIFTVQEWVGWYRGSVGFEDADYAISSTMIFLAAQTITHVLARMSANFGIEEKRIHQVAMKNEYRFDIFTPTQVAKHYFAMKGVQEGVVFAEYEKEIKGVHLKSSKAPKAIIAQATDMMIDIMNTVMAGKKVSIRKILKEIAETERSIVRSIEQGSYEYFSYAQIRPPESYTQEELKSNYIHYLLWRDVFAPKYGECPEPTYLGIKVSTDLDKPAVMKAWLASMEDRELAARMEQWLVLVNRKATKTFILPEQVIAVVGIPKEIMQVVNVRGLVAETTKIFYLILETLGIYYPDKRNTRLAMDEH